MSTCIVTGGAGRDLLTGGSAVDLLLGGAANDKLLSDEDSPGDVNKCGKGEKDRVRRDAQDTARGCEIRL